MTFLEQPNANDFSSTLLLPMWYIGSAFKTCWLIKYLNVKLHQIII